MGPRGIKSFLKHVCSECVHISPGCQENLELCILAEISYYVKRLALIAELSALGEKEKLREILREWDGGRKYE